MQFIFCAALLLGLYFFWRVMFNVKPAYVVYPAPQKMPASDTHDSDYVDLTVQITEIESEEDLQTTVQLIRAFEIKYRNSCYGENYLNNLIDLWTKAETKILSNNKN